MNSRWWAALAAVLMMGACTGREAPSGPTSSAGPSAAPAVQAEQVPAGYFRKPKDGEVCKKIDLAALQAVVPGIEAGPSSGVFHGTLKCEFQVMTPSLVLVTFGARMFDSAEQAAKHRETILNYLGTVPRTVTLPVSKAEAFVTDGALDVYEQNMHLGGGVYATDKAMVTERLTQTIQRIVDDFLIVVRKEFQSTTGPSPTAQAQRERRVVSPQAVNGKRLAGFDGRQFDKILFALRFALDHLGASPAVAATYGSSKSNNIMIFAATLAVIKTDAQIDATLLRLALEGITMSKPASDKLDEWTEIRCGEAKIKEFTGAMCLWRDKDSIGVAVFPGQKPADVKADFLTLRKLATEG